MFSTGGKLVLVRISAPHLIRYEMMTSASVLLEMKHNTAAAVHTTHSRRSRIPIAEQTGVQNTAR